MSIFRKFRASTRHADHAETSEVRRIMKRGPHDSPVDLRHSQSMSRMMGGW